jgi:hypothetical protein
MQLDRMEEWCADDTLSVLLVATSLPLMGAEGESSVVGPIARRILKLALQWESQVMHAIFAIVQPGVSDPLHVLHTRIVCPHCLGGTCVASSIVCWLCSPCV